MSRWPSSTTLRLIISTTNVLRSPSSCRSSPLVRSTAAAERRRGWGRALDRLCRVFLPLTCRRWPRLILVFILTLGFFITPAILGGGRVPMIANMIDMLINRLPRWELAAALSTVLLVATFVCYALYLRIGRAAQPS